MKLTALIVSMVLCMAAAPAKKEATDAPRPVDVRKFKETIKLACVGDSITQGVGASGGHAYPDLLGPMLGAKWQVKNFGLSGTTLLKKGEKPYWTCQQFADAKAFVPDVVSIALGTNDSKPDSNWKHKEEFVADYKALIEEFRKINPKVIVYACLPVPAFGSPWGISEEVINGELIPLVRKVAKEAGVNTIDLHAALNGKTGKATGARNGMETVNPKGLHGM